MEEELISSKSGSWGGGGGGWSLYIKIGYREPTLAESREGTSRRWELSGDLMLDSYDSGDVILGSDWLTKLKGFFMPDSDWLTKYEGFSCSILIGCRQFFGFGHKLSVFDNVLR